MLEMKDIPGTPSWIGAGAKSTTSESATQPAAVQQSEENKDTKQTTE